MEMTLKRLGLTDLKEYIDGSYLRVLGYFNVGSNDGITTSSLFVDTFFVSNILISLVILMVSLQIYCPLDFSSFPVC